MHAIVDTFGVLLACLLVLFFLALVSSCFLVTRHAHWRKWPRVVLLAFSTPALASGIPPGNFIFPIPVVFAAEAPKLTVAEALSLLTALRTLDGHQIKVYDKDGKETGQVIMQPWDFGSGLLRLKIANDITITAAVEKRLDDARQAILKEILKDEPGVTSLKPDTPEMAEFAKQYGQALNAPAQGLEDLAHIKASELKLEKNEISVTALSALRPILDIDVDLR
jgi:hypothetical protein